MVCYMPKSCMFPSLDSCQKRFLWTHKEVDLAPHPVVGLVLQVRDTDFFSMHLVSKPGSFFRFSKQGPCFLAIEEDGSDKRLVELKLACKADGVALPDPVESGHCCHC